MEVSAVKKRNSNNSFGTEILNNIEYFDKDTLNLKPNFINYDEEIKLEKTKSKKNLTRILAHITHEPSDSENKGGENKSENTNNNNNNNSPEENEDNDTDEDESEDKSRLRLSTREIENNYLIGFILTIRSSVTFYSKMNLEITPEDCKSVRSFYIMPVGAPDRLLVREYGGKIFEYFRRTLSLSPESYLGCWSQADIKGASRSSGKSDSSFVHSYDNRFLIKTLSSMEVTWLIKILPSLYEHFKEHQGSLLTRFLGLYRIVDANKKTIHFTVIPNIFQTKKMTELYDLKGSTVQRSRKSPNSPLLDLDVKRKIYLGKEKKDEFMKQLKADAKFLADNNLMDYSLLVGVCESDTSNDIDGDNGAKCPGMVYFLEEDIKKNDKKESIVREPQMNITPAKPSIKRSRLRDNIQLENAKEKLTKVVDLSIHEFEASNSPQNEMYFMGIIDFLQKYNSKKKLFGFAKSLKYDKDGLSTVAPGFYSRRFVEFIDSLIE